MSKPKLTQNEIGELLMLIAVADDEYIVGYGGKPKVLASAHKKLRQMKEQGAKDE